MPDNALPNKVSEWGIVVVSVLVLLIYLAALTFAYFSKNDTLLTTLLGVAATNATTAVGFWLGSSYGSAKKTNLLATTPVATPPATT